ncbi:MAG: IS110 family transposase [Zoogloea sp.]|nr:IS110 family transposase [Zoogloea sp.]
MELLLPPHRTRPYTTGNKTDRADAKGLLEAFRNEQIQPVPVKSIDQQALAALHRLRAAWLRSATLARARPTTRVDLATRPQPSTSCMGMMAIFATEPSATCISSQETSEATTLHPR